MIKSFQALLVVLILSGVPLQAKSLEIREFTVRAELASGNFLSPAEARLLDQGLIACNQKLSLRVPASGKIGYRETKPLPYGAHYDKQGNPGEILKADVGVIFSGKLEKRGATYVLQFKYSHTSLMDNAINPSHGALRIFQPEFQDIEIDSGGVTLAPNQWLILGGVNKESGVTNLIALKLVL
jgi:hypothetical protein